MVLARQVKDQYIDLQHFGRQEAFKTKKEKKKEEDEDEKEEKKEKTMTRRTNILLK